MILMSFIITLIYVTNKYFFIFKDVFLKQHGNFGAMEWLRIFVAPHSSVHGMKLLLGRTPISPSCALCSRQIQEYEQVFIIFADLPI